MDAGPERWECQRKQHRFYKDACHIFSFGSTTLEHQGERQPVPVSSKQKSVKGLLNFDQKGEHLEARHNSVKQLGL